MESRAMVVVGGGASTRFGTDKLMTAVAGEPLMAHTVRRVRSLVDTCVLVCREDQVDQLGAMGLDVTLTVGGATRTDSERAGLAALGADHELIGVHDAARPLATISLMERLFQRAAEIGGAIPVVGASTLLIDRRTHRRVTEAVAAQTPQVFRGPELLEAYTKAARFGYEGHDTADVVRQFGRLEIAAVPGETGNLKVTYQTDLEVVERHLRDGAHNEPL